MAKATANKLVVKDNEEACWRSLYKAAGVAVVLPVLLYLADIALSFKGVGTKLAALPAVEWFAVFKGNALLGLRDLGLFNVVALVLMLPVYVGFYGAHRRSEVKAGVVLAMALLLVGAAVYIANNAALPMFVLSGKYAAATTEAQRSALAAAGEAVLAQGEDFTLGAFAGFLLTEFAGLTISLVLHRSRLFGTAAAHAGVLGYGLLSIYTLLATFVPRLILGAMLVALVGGISVLIWYVQVARGFFRLGRSEQGSASGSASLSR